MEPKKSDLKNNKIDCKIFFDFWETPTKNSFAHENGQSKGKVKMKNVGNGKSNGNGKFFFGQ